jgi:hypothetical protein
MKITVVNFGTQTLKVLICFQLKFKESFDSLEGKNMT